MSTNFVVTQAAASHQMIMLSDETSRMRTALDTVRYRSRLTATTGQCITGLNTPSAWNRRRGSTCNNGRARNHPSSLADRPTYRPDTTLRHPSRYQRRWKSAAKPIDRVVLIYIATNHIRRSQHQHDGTVYVSEFCRSIVPTAVTKPRSACDAAPRIQKRTILALEVFARSEVTSED